MATFAKTFDVDISTGRPAASNEAYYHGETIEFRAVRGRTVVTNVEYSCVYYQTNGMDSVWWNTDGLTFHPTNDVGAASYRFFLEGRDDLGRDWHANGLLRLLPSPGFEPSVVELPVKTLDFATVEILNAPYYTKAETDAAATLTPISSDTPTFSAWVCQPDIVTVYWDDFRNMWQTGPAESTNVSEEMYNPNATNIVFSLESDGGEVTATRTRTDIIGYTLGSQGDKPLQPKGDYALRSDIPPAVSNTVTKAYVESLGITSEETDPTVPAWAKASTKPTYSAAEVGAATMGDIIRVVSGTNVVLVITNYNSAVHAPSMKIQRLNPETGEFETYWDETIRHGMTLDSAKEYTDNATNNLAAVKADRAFGKYTSGFGVDAPKGVTWLSGGTTVFGAGHDFAKTVTSSGEIFTLVNSGLMLTNVECPTNSAFWQLEANGETLYRVEKTSSHVVDINIHAVSVVDPYLLIDLSGWIYPEHPVARVRLDLADADWLKEEDYTGGVIPGVAAITWLGSGSANDPYICQIENLSGGDRIFAGLWYEAPGATKIIANGVSDLTKGIYYNGATYLPSVSGNELKFMRAQ